jgi:hypothetical protein
MINWGILILDSIWIIALGLALSVISILYWEARLKSIKIKALLGHTKYTMPLFSAGALFCLGMALRSVDWWENVLLGLFTGVFLISIWKINQSREQ